MTGSLKLNHPRQMIMRWFEDMEDRFRQSHPVLMFAFEAIAFGAMMAMFLILLVLVADLP